MQSLLSVAAIATLLAQASPAPAPAPGAASGPSWSAIEVQKCAMVPRGGYARVNQGIEIDFTNNASVAATHVTFAVKYQGQSAAVPVSGTFGPGAAIKKTLLNQFVGVRLTSLTPDVCRVQVVTFADGTTSTAPAQPGP
jgi:hypothetical protein